MIRGGVKIRGDKAVAKRLDSISKKMPSARDMSISAEAYRILRASQAVVPVEFRDLKRSGRVDPVSGAKKGSVWIRYETAYALRQHEELSYYHPRGGKAKYLEDPLDAEKHKMAKRIAEFVAKRTGIR